MDFSNGKNIQVGADASYDGVNEIMHYIENEISPHIAGNKFDFCLETRLQKEESIFVHKIKIAKVKKQW